MKKWPSLIILTLCAFMVIVLVSSFVNFSQKSEAMFENYKNSISAFDGHIQLKTTVPKKGYIEEIIQKLHQYPNTKTAVPITKQSAILINNKEIIQVELFIVPDTAIANIPMLDKEVDLRPDVDGKVFLLNTSAALQVNHRREGTLRLAFLSDNGTIIRIKPKKPTVASLPIESGRFDIPKVIVNESFLNIEAFTLNHQISVWLNDDSLTQSFVSKLEADLQNTFINSWLKDKSRMSEALKKERQYFKFIFLALMIPLIFITLIIVFTFKKSKAQN